MRVQTAPGTPAQTSGLKSAARWPIIGGVVLALAVLALAITFSLLHLRHRIFAQVANRDGETLVAIAAVQFANDKENDQSVTTLEDPSEQIQLALKISNRLRSVLGVRLFSAEGKFITAFPAYITETPLPAEDLEALSHLRPVSHYMARARLTEQDLLAETNSEPVPLLVVNVPLGEDGDGRLEGIAQFLVHGSSIAQEYAQLDRHLAAQGALVFFITGTIITGGLLLAFRRVEHAHQLLAERTGNLLKANRELALAAKTSAIGAVTSHLIHGLRNPLSGLRSFVQDRAQAQDSRPESDWQLAAATAQRMQTLIDGVVRVLQEQQTVAEYELSFGELLDVVEGKFQVAAQTAGVKYCSILQANGTLSNRQADLLLLILENLVQNAIEATGAGKAVEVRISLEEENLVVEVEDQGAGLPAERVEHLFTPCASAKQGGSGIGLAISRQLAIHLGAKLDLKRTSSDGSCFRLTLPSSGMKSAATQSTRPVAQAAAGEASKVR